MFDILGKTNFDNRSLRELLIEAIRYGNAPETRAKLYQVVDKALDKDALRKLLEERALTEDTMDVHKVMAIREEMERMEAHKLQPHFIEAFFIEAFTVLGGIIRKREPGRYEIISVPYRIRSRDQLIGFGVPVASKYERVCFDKQYCNMQGLPIADQICPGHPLLEAVIDLIREQNADVLKRGAVLVDENDPSEKSACCSTLRMPSRMDTSCPTAAAGSSAKHCNLWKWTNQGRRGMQATHRIWITAR